jgi:hypothetical protein
MDKHLEQEDHLFEKESLPLVVDEQSVLHHLVNGDQQELQVRTLGEALKHHERHRSEPRNERSF